jgi:hypothetical protein
MNTPRVIAAALTVPFALALAGCAQAGSESSDDPVIRYDWDADGPAMLALLTTTLELTDGCLMGADGQFIAFPRDLATWNADAETLEYGGETFAMGDTINAGGGGGSLPDDATIPAGCELEDGAAVFLIQTTALS